MLASVLFLPVPLRGFAKMGHRGVDRIASNHGVNMGVSGRNPGVPGGENMAAITPGGAMKIRFYARPASGPALLRIFFRIAPIAVLAIFGLSTLGLYAQSAMPGYSSRRQARSARAEYKIGQKAEARQDYDAAFTAYHRAYNIDPSNIRYRTAYFRTRVTAAAMHVTKGRALLQAGNTQGALVEFLHANEIDPADEAADQEIAHIREMQSGTPPKSALPIPASEQHAVNSMGAPPQLKPLSNAPLTLHMTEDAKVIYQAVGKAAGINVLFDPDYHSNRIQIDLNNVSLMDALRIVATVSNTFWRPVTSNTIFVAQNTRIKHTELDEQAVQTFYLTNAWQQNDMNDIQTALRSVIRSAQFYGVASQNAIVARGTPDELLLAQKLIDDLDKARPEVVVDIAVLEVSKNWERTLGISWPSSASVAIQPATSSSSSGSGSGSGSGSNTTTPTLYDLAHLKASDFAVNIGQATLNLLLNNANTQILQSPSIRAVDGQKAELKIGSRIPIATGSYQTGAATALVSSLVNTQFQYINVGVQVTMTPTVHYNNDVTLKMDIEVSAQSGQVTISGVTEPIISQRIINQVIRLREGQASILGGIQNNQTQKSWTGIPGLSTIPILKYIFGSNDHSVSNDDIVFVVVPHVVRSEMLTQANLRPIDTGSGQSINLRMMQSKTSAASARPTAYVQPNLGTVPGSSAAGAAPAALQEMQSMDHGQTGPPPGTSQPSPPAVAPQPAPAPAPSPPAAGALSFALQAPPGPVAKGSTFQVPVVLSSGANVASVPLQLHYDPKHLSLVNVAEGRFLGRDNQAVALVHRDDGPGDLTVVASRPPGAPGLSGSGVVCVLTFQAKASGSSTLAITRAGVVNTAQKQVTAGNSQVSITVR